MLSTSCFVINDVHSNISISELCMIFIYQMNIDSYHIYQDINSITNNQVIR